MHVLGAAGCGAGSDGRRLLLPLGAETSQLWRLPYEQGPAGDVASRPWCRQKRDLGPDGSPRRSSRPSRAPDSPKPGDPSE